MLEDVQIVQKDARLLPIPTLDGASTPERIQDGNSPTARRDQTLNWKRSRAAAARHVHSVTISPRWMKIKEKPTKTWPQHEQMIMRMITSAVSTIWFSR